MSYYVLLCPTMSYYVLLCPTMDVVEASYSLFDSCLFPRLKIAQNKKSWEV